MLNTRLQISTEFKVLEYLTWTYPDVDRVYPEFLPTQASGRWSIKNPPLNNYPPDTRDVLVPDAGMSWIGWDLDAIEAKIVAALSHDKLDLKAFDENLDIHTITACKMTGLELPPDLKDPHQSPIAADWREKHSWEGKDDKRRLLAKVRYALLYGKDYTAASGSKYEMDWVKRGYKRDDFIAGAKRFLESKPWITSAKNRHWNEYAKTGKSYTIFGRRRMLFGDWWSKAKEGFNHLVQGSVADMTNTAIIELCHPQDGLGLLFVNQAHDGGKIAIAEDSFNPELVSVFKAAVEKPYVIEGEKIVSRATWWLYKSDGSKEPIA